MQTDWKTTTLGTLGDFRNGVNFNREQEGIGLPVLKVKDFGDRVVCPLDSLDELNSALFQASPQQLLAENDIVVIRSNGNPELVGRSVVVQKVTRPTTFSGFCIRFRPDPTRIDARFAAYFLRSPQARHRMTRFGSGTGIQNLNQEILSGIPIDLPDLDEQVAISDVLVTLDDKIEQNRRTGRVLEGLARGVFQAWFVDFEPVKAKASGQTCFPGMLPVTFAALPDRFVDSELGPVPEGWEVTTAGELASFILGGDWGKDTPTEDSPDPALCIRGADIPDLWANGLGKMPIRYLKRGSLQKRSLHAGDIAVEISGGSPTQSTGRPVLVTDSLLGELPHPLVCSNFCRIFRPKQNHANFSYFLFRQMYDTEQFLQYENGTTGIKNFAFTRFCEVHPVVIPHENLLVSFDAWCEPLMQTMAHVGSESRRLAALRDYLLPRLLSGRVRVKSEPNGDR